MSRCKYCGEETGYDERMSFIWDNEFISRLGENIKEGFYCESCTEEFEPIKQEE